MLASRDLQLPKNIYGVGDNIRANFHIPGTSSFRDMQNDQKYSGRLWRHSDDVKGSSAPNITHIEISINCAKLRFPSPSSFEDIKIEKKILGGLWRHSINTTATLKKKSCLYC